MLTVKLKGPPTIGKLQGPFEASLKSSGTLRMYSPHLDAMVKYFGHSTAPDDVQRFQVEEFKSTCSNWRITVAACRSFYRWIMYKGFGTTNPFIPLRRKIANYNDVEVIFE